MELHIPIYATRIDRNISSRVADSIAANIGEGLAPESWSLDDWTPEEEMEYGDGRPTLVTLWRTTAHVHVDVPRA